MTGTSDELVLWRVGYHADPVGFTPLEHDMQHLDLHEITTSRRAITQTIAADLFDRGASAIRWLRIRSGQPASGWSGSGWPGRVHSVWGEPAAR